MRAPQVTDRLKEAPAQALRAVFSGVGSVLLVADRLRHRNGQETSQGNGHPAPPAPGWEANSSAAPAPAPESGSPAAPAPGGSPAAQNGSPAAEAGSAAEASSAAPPAPHAPVAPATSADSPASAKAGDGSVKAAPAPAKGGGGSAKAARASANGRGGAATATAASANGSGGAATATAASLDGVARGSGAADGLPLAGYDGLTVAQLRARMRTLDPAQLRALIAHERTHAGRDDVVAMFERRIAKVESGG